MFSKVMHMFFGKKMYTVFDFFLGVLIGAGVFAKLGFFGGLAAVIVALLVSDFLGRKYRSTADV